MIHNALLWPILQVDTSSMERKEDERTGRTPSDVREMFAGVALRNALASRSTGARRPAYGFIELERP